MYVTVPIIGSINRTIFQTPWRNAMTSEQKIAGLLSAKTKIGLIRARHTQFDLPLADAKLVRINHYISEQVAELEAEVWREAGLTEVQA